MLIVYITGSIKQVLITFMYLLTNFHSLLPHQNHVIVTKKSLKIPKGNQNP
jgi:hypothetical protein